MQVLHPRSEYNAHLTNLESCPGESWLLSKVICFEVPQLWGAEV